MSGDHPHPEYVYDFAINANAGRITELDETVTAALAEQAGTNKSLTNLAVDTVTAVNELRQRFNKHLELDFGTADPPAPPLDSFAVQVPIDANWQWFIDHASASQFNFNHNYNGHIPAFTNTTYEGFGRSENKDIHITESGLAHSKTYKPRTVLSSPNNQPMFIKHGSGVHTNVIIRGFEFKNCGAENLQDASVIDFTDFINSGVDRCHLHHNEGNPIRLDGDGTYVNNSLLHDNAHLAIAGSGAKDTFITHNEIYNNSTSHKRWAWEHGGIKLTRGSGSVSNNYVHDESHGIWTDINDRHDIVGNYVEDCGISGIFAGELMLPSDHIVQVRGNYATGNGNSAHDDIWTASNAQIKLANGSGIAVTNNDIVQTGPFQRGLSIVQQARERKGEWYYADEIDVTGNRFKRNNTRQPRFSINDDTDHIRNQKYVEQGFIIDYLTNWLEPELVNATPRRLAARINQGTWGSVMDNNEWN